MQLEVQEVLANWNWEGEADKGGASSVSTDKSLTKVRLGWGVPLWPMTHGPRSGKTKTQVGGEHEVCLEPCLKARPPHAAVTGVSCQVSM